MPKVSVIVPNYNHASYLHQRIDSILNQTYTDFELILLDDCSTDNSRDILSVYSNHPKVSHCVFNEQNSGSTFIQWERGVEFAQGEYIWIAESDDWAEVEFLKTVVTEIEKNAGVGLVYTGSKLIDSDGVITYFNDKANTGDRILHDGVKFITKKLAVSNVIWNASMVVFKKSLFAANDKSLFVNMKYCGDWFFYVLTASQTNVLEIRMTLSNFRIHKGNVSTEAEKSGKSFTEGLMVYNYIRKFLSPTEIVKSSFQWAKSLYKYQIKYNPDSETMKQLFSLISERNKLILLGYRLYKLIN